MNQEKQEIDDLVKIATELINKRTDDVFHTVGSATISESGEVFSGVNVGHFDGGPCAEITAISQAVSQGDKNLKLIVAVGNNDRGVISPCGKCRQILFDYFPNINVIVRRDEGLVEVCVKELLPDTFDWNAQ
jgi:cytidine deaminase